MIRGAAGIHFVDIDRSDKITRILSPNGSRGSLYLGNQAGARDLSLLQSLKITAIITVASEIKLKHPNIDHLHIDIDDSPSQNIGTYFDKTFYYIDKKLKTGNVLVHCKMGISRSASIVIAYLMNSFGLSAQEATDKVRNKRQIINPNKGFAHQLQMYGKRVKQQRSQRNTKTIKKT